MPELMLLVFWWRLLRSKRTAPTPRGPRQRTFRKAEHSTYARPGREASGSKRRTARSEPFTRASGAHSLGDVGNAN
jgi:hypothetical protein